MAHEQIGVAAEIMDRLWLADGWEAAQTHESLLPYLLEETYELIDAVRQQDCATVREELGDLLLQVLFHARIAEAAGEFTVNDVAADLVAKLNHRSPHLSTGLSGTSAQRIAAQELAWERAKAAEKSRESCLDGIALQQPALALADKIVSRALKAGFPAVLVPGELRAVRVGPGAELELRAAALSFATRVRAIEADAGNGERRQLSAEEWTGGWSRFS